MLRSALAFALVAIAASSCHTAPLASPDPHPDVETTTRFGDPRARPLDLLFVIDDSSSMDSEQGKLMLEFPTLLEVLQQAPGGLPDLHVGIVTSDQGACSRVAFPTGRMQAKTSCGLQAGHRFVAAAPNGVRNFDGDLASVFGCLALVGTGGCGFEQQLRAIGAALDNPENAGFLRDDAVLGIVVVTDEDDCSGPPSDFFTMMTPEAGSFRCSARGHLCNGAPPAAMQTSYPYSSCTADPDGGGVLTPVAALVDDLKRRKRDPGSIVVSIITGLPEAPATARYAVGPSESTAERGKIDVVPICRDGSDTAAPALRLTAFAGAFGAQGSVRSICRADFKDAIREFAERVRPGRRCLAKAGLYDADPEAPGIQPECTVLETATEAEQSVALGACRDGGPRPCWRLTASSACHDDELAFEVERAGEAPRVTDEVHCRTCASAGDPGCAQ